MDEVKLLMPWGEVVVASTPSQPLLEAVIAYKEVANVCTMVFSSAVPLDALARNINKIIVNNLISDYDWQARSGLPTRTPLAIVVNPTVLDWLAASSNGFVPPPFERKICVCEMRDLLSVGHNPDCPEKH